MALTGGGTAADGVQLADLRIVDGHGGGEVAAVGVIRHAWIVLPHGVEREVSLKRRNSVARVVFRVRATRYGVGRPALEGVILTGGLLLGNLVAPVVRHAAARRRAGAAVGVIGDGAGRRRHIDGIEVDRFTLCSRKVVYRLPRQIIHLAVIAHCGPARQRIALLRLKSCPCLQNCLVRKVKDIIISRGFFIAIRIRGPIMYLILDRRPLRIQRLRLQQVGIGKRLHRRRRSTVRVVKEIRAVIRTGAVALEVIACTGRNAHKRGGICTKNEVRCASLLLASAVVLHQCIRAVGYWGLQPAIVT